MVFSRQMVSMHLPPSPVSSTHRPCHITHERRRKEGRNCASRKRTCGAASRSEPTDLSRREQLSQKWKLTGRSVSGGHLPVHHDLLLPPSQAVTDRLRSQKNTTTAFNSGRRIYTSTEIPSPYTSGRASAIRVYVSSHFVRSKRQHNGRNENITARAQEAN